METRFVKTMEFFEEISHPNNKDMKCSQMRLAKRPFKPPPRVSKCDSAPTANLTRPCVQRSALCESPQRYSSSRSQRSLSPQTINSDPSSPESSKTPLIICNLNLQPNVKTLAPNVKRSAKKLPPFCVQFQNAINKNSAIQESNIKTINDFIVQGTLIANHRRRIRQKSHATHLDSPDIIINCEDDDCNECKNSFSDNVFNNINTDLLLSLDCYEMDSFGRLPGDSRTPTPIPSIAAPSPVVVSSLSSIPPSTLLAVPPGYRPLSLRTPSPNTRSIIRIDVVNRDKNRTEPNIKDIDFNVNRLKEKRGLREQKSEK